MDDNIHVLDIDIKQQNYIDEPIVRQNDDVVFIINVMDDDEPFDLSDVSTSTLSVERADKNKVISNGSITDVNQITFKLPRSSVTIVGKSKATVQLYGVDNRVSTFTFPFWVEKDPSGEDWVPDDGEKTLIEIVLGVGPQVIEDAKDATQKALDATGDATQAINDTNAVKNATESVRQDTLTVKNETQAVKEQAEQKLTEVEETVTQVVLDIQAVAEYANTQGKRAEDAVDELDTVIDNGPVLSINGKVGIVEGFIEDDDYATNNAYGIVRVDGETIVSNDGVISVNQKNDKILLYDRGVEFDNITGGWLFYMYNSADGFYQKNKNNMEMNLTSDGSRRKSVTSEPINLQKINKIKVDLEGGSHTDDATSSVRIVLHEGASHTAPSGVANTTITSGVIDRGVYELDVSSITGEYHVSVMVLNDAGVSGEVWVKVYAVWGEE